MAFPYFTYVCINAIQIVGIIIILLSLRLAVMTYSNWLLFNKILYCNSLCHMTSTIPFHTMCRDKLYILLSMYVYIYILTYILPTVCTCLFQAKLNAARLYVFLLLYLEYIHLAYHYYCGGYTV